jgi:uncharacterized protein
MAKKKTKKRPSAVKRRSPGIGQFAETHSHGAAFQQQYGVQIQVNTPSQPENQAKPTVPELPLVSDLNDPIRLGVHPAVSEDGNRVPRYVERDTDENIEQSLEDGSFVLIVGDSTSGKSRSAYEVIRKRLPNYKILIPATSEDLLQSWTYLREVDRCIIWLDDFEIFLGSEGFNIQMLDRIRSRNSVLLATIRAEEYSNLSPLSVSRLDNDQTRRRGVGRILEQATVIHLERRWSEDEVARARSSSDRRVIEASAHAGVYGVAEYLAAGPQLYAEWLAAWAPGAHPRGAALVSAAIDLRRAGFNIPVPAQVLNDLHTYYLESRGGDILRPEPLDAAFTWARTPLHATSSLLLPVTEDKFFAFDYLVDTIQRQPGAKPIPDLIWNWLLDNVPNAEIWQIGRAAEWVSRSDVATIAFERLARQGDGHGAFHVGLSYLNRKELDDAIKWFKEAADAGDASAAYYLGKVLTWKEQYDDAEPPLRQAMQLGSASIKALAAGQLGTVEAHRGKWPEAEKLLKSAVTALEESEENELADEPFAIPPEAEESIRQLDIENKRLYESTLAHALHMNDKLDEAGIWYRKIAENGDIEAANNLGLILKQRGRKGEAYTWFSRAAAKGNLYGQVNLGRSLEERGELEKAKFWYRKAADTGDGDAAAALGRIYNRRGDRKNALLWLNRAEEAGSAFGTFLLGEILEKSKKLEKASELYEKAGNLGYSHALFHLGLIQQKESKTAEAEDSYRRAAEAGDEDAMVFLGDLILRRLRNLGRDGTLTVKSERDLLSEAEKWYLCAKEDGHSKADERLRLCSELAENGTRSLIEDTDEAKDGAEGSASTMKRGAKKRR